MYIALKMKGDFENLGMVPIWPPLWHNKLTFNYTTFVLMLRHNLQSFDRQHLRPITIQSTEALLRVILEISWQLCAWLERYQCRQTADNFLKHILRFHDVIPNYITACFAVLDMDENMFRNASCWDWSQTLFTADEKLLGYLTNEKELSRKYKNVDFFLNDTGYKAILQAALPLDTDTMSPRVPAKSTPLP